MRGEYDGIHHGHRGRMRDKLVKHGASIFDTYELLEMLLYNVIPYKDTNPIAKVLLSRFGSLDGVLSATEEELMSVSGIGRRCAELLRAVGELTAPRHGLSDESHSLVFDDYVQTGAYIAHYFEREQDTQIVVLLLDGCMRFLDMCNIPGDNFGSAAVKPKYFIDAAMRASATVAVIANTHRHGPLFPTSSDIATSRMVREELAYVGVRVAEHYIVTGDRFIGVDAGLSLKLCSGMPALERFLRSRREGIMQASFE